MRAGDRVAAGWREALGEPSLVDDDALGRAYSEGQAAWPGFEVSPEAFGRRLAAVVDRLDTLPSTLEALRPAEQYLVAGCLADEPAAIAALQTHALAPVPHVAARFGGAIDADDLCQRVLTRLLARHDGEPGLAAFSGVTHLPGWVRIIALRIALDEQRSHDRRQRRHDALPESLPAMDPELALMRKLYAEQFSRLLDEQIAALSPRERNLLRSQVVHRMTLPAIAKLHGVHRATAARWLRDARVALLEGSASGCASKLG